MLEARSEREPGSRALTLHARTLELLSLRGMSGELIARGRAVAEIALVTGPGRAVHLHLDELDSPFPFVLVLPQAETEEVLELRLRELGGVPRRGERLVAVEPGPNHVVATTVRRRVRARWVVAADGAHSTVRHLLQAPVRAARESWTYYGADVSLDGVDPQLQVIWSAQGFGVLVPFRDGTFRVAVTAPVASGQVSEPALTDVQRQVDRVFPRRLLLRDPTWLTVLRSGHRQLLNYRHGRVLFAGDAAHTHNPAGGQGMNIGLHDAFNLGWKLAAVVTGDADERLLDTYHDERHPAAARVLAQTQRSMQLAHLRSPPSRMLRDQVMHHLPAPLRRRLLEQVAGLDVDCAPPGDRTDTGFRSRQSRKEARMTITEDLVVLLLDPTTGRSLVDSTSLDNAIGGALLLDLATRGRLSADGDGAKARLTVTDLATTGDALLDDALARLAGGPVRAQKAVARLARRTRMPVLERLGERGLVRREKSRLLGVFPVTTWPPVDVAPRARLLARVTAVLRDGAEPDQHVALLVSLLHAVRAEHKVVSGARRELRARAKEVAASDWAGPAVRKAVQAVQASVMVAVTAATAAGAEASGS